MNVKSRTKRVLCVTAAFVLAISMGESALLPRDMLLRPSNKGPSPKGKGGIDPVRIGFPGLLVGSTKKESKKIANGSPALDKESQLARPYVVSLRRRSDKGYFCAGVLIGSRHVLTAAHCVDSSRTSADNKPLVVVGSASSTKTSGPGVQVISSKKVIIHPEYRSRRNPNLAILELNTPAKPSPVRIPTSQEFNPARGQSLQVLGWGRKSSSSSNSDTIQDAFVPYIPPRGCQNLIRRSVSSSQFCLGGKGAGTCPGDDGGPIVLHGSSSDTLVGIIGSSHICAKSSSLPDLHTRVAPYIGWITSNAKG